LDQLASGSISDLEKISHSPTRCSTGRKFRSEHRCPARRLVVAYAAADARTSEHCQKQQGNQLPAFPCPKRFNHSRLVRFRIAFLVVAIYSPYVAAEKFV